MEDLLPSVIVQYIVVGTYEVTMVWEYQGPVQIFKSRVVFREYRRSFVTRNRWRESKALNAKGVHGL